MSNKRIAEIFIKYYARLISPRRIGLRIENSKYLSVSYGDRLALFQKMS